MNFSWIHINWVEVLLELGAFLIVSYFIFYKSFLKAIGKQQAKIATIEELTSLEENVKQSFKKDLEEYKSNLSKDNIAYHISLAEVTKHRLQRIEQLVENLLLLQYYVKHKIYTSASSEDYKDYYQYYQNAEISSKICALYLPEELYNKIAEVIETIHEAFAYFIDYQDKKQYDRSESQDKMIKALDKFPLLIDGLTSEFQRQIVLRDI